MNPDNEKMNAFNKMNFFFLSPFYTKKSRYKVGVIYFLRTHVCNINTDDQNKLNNMMVANMDDK